MAPCRPAVGGGFFRCEAEEGFSVEMKADGGGLWSIASQAYVERRTRTEHRIQSRRLIRK
jgi:hypothetical protein